MSIRDRRPSPRNTDKRDRMRQMRTNGRPSFQVRNGRNRRNGFGSMFVEMFREAPLFFKLFFGAVASFIILCFALVIGSYVWAGASGVLGKADATGANAQSCTVKSVNDIYQGEGVTDYHVSTEQCGLLVITDGIGGMANSAERANSLNVGETYRMTTFGFDVPALGIYKNITSFEK